MLFQIEYLLPGFWRSLGVTPELAKQCLKARLETLGCEKLDDGYEPDYWAACKDIPMPKNIHAITIGEVLYDNLNRWAIAECT